VTPLVVAVYSAPTDHVPSQSIGGSLRLPLLQNGACPFPCTPLLGVLMLGTHTPRERVLAPPRFRSLGKSAFRDGKHAGGCASRACLARPPSGTGPVFWRVASDSWLYLSGYRPDVSISWALPLALASSGILLPNRMQLAPPLCDDPPQREPLGVPPFPVPIGRIRRAVLSTGFLWQCRPVSMFGCRRPILCRFGSSASASCAGST